MSADPALGDEVLGDERWQRLLHQRAEEPSAIAAAYAGRRTRARLRADGRLLLVAADHPARGALGVGSRPDAMADRRSLLARLCTALACPDVDGVLATPDIVEDLLLLGVLEDRLVVGSMNRGGLAGAVWELDDPITAYTADAITTSRLDGGKLLVRIDDTDPGTRSTLAAAAAAVTALAAHGRMAMLEPLPYRRDEASGRTRLDDDPDRLVRAVAVASGLGATAAHTWLKLPATPDAARVLGATTLPCLLLGGEVGAGDSTWDAWRAALALPNARGLVVGRTLLYPPDGDVAGAVRAAAGLVHGEAR